MNYRDVDRILRENGFEMIRRRGKGPHRMYRYGSGAELRTVSVPFHGTNADIKPGTLRSIIHRSGLDPDLFR